LGRHSRNRAGCRQHHHRQGKARQTPAEESGGQEMIRRSMLLSAALVIAVLVADRAEPQDYLGKSAAEWQRQLATKDARTRRDAAFALGKLGRGADEAVADLLK